MPAYMKQPRTIFSQCLHELIEMFAASLLVTSCYLVAEKWKLSAQKITQVTFPYYPSNAPAVLWVTLPSRHNKPRRNVYCWFQISESVQRRLSWSDCQGTSRKYIYWQGINFINAPQVSRQKCMGYFPNRSHPGHRALNVQHQNVFDKTTYLR